MRKYFTFGLILSLFSVACFAEHPQVEQLIAEKQEKMKKLEDCQGTTKKLKIAGISTLGVTAVGVIGNVAEAKVLSDTNKEVTIAKAQLKQAQEKKKKANGESGDEETVNKISSEIQPDENLIDKFTQLCIDNSGEPEGDSRRFMWRCAFKATCNDVQSAKKQLEYFNAQLKCTEPATFSNGTGENVVNNLCHRYQKGKDFIATIYVYCDKPICPIKGQIFDGDEQRCRCIESQELNNDKTACVPKQK